MGRLLLLTVLLGAVGCSEEVTLRLSEERPGFAGAVQGLYGVEAVAVGSRSYRISGSGLADLRDVWSVLPYREGALPPLAGAPGGQKILVRFVDGAGEAPLWMADLFGLSERRDSPISGLTSFRVDPRVPLDALLVVLRRLTVVSAVQVDGGVGLHEAGTPSPLQKR